MSRVAVLHVITMLELGGAQRNTLDTVRRLDRQRFRVGLACADRGELLAEARTVADLELFELSHLRREVRPYEDVRAVGEIRSAIRAMGADIVHTHSSKAGILGRLAARREGVGAVVHSIHGYGFGPHQPVPVRAAFLGAERLASRWTSAFVAVSRRNLEQGVALGLFAPEDARVIRSGIDLAAFRRPHGGAAARRELGIPLDAPMVLQVSCFKAQKAPERFVDVAAQVARAVPEAHFVMVGDGELRGAVEARARAVALGGRLHLPGWRRDVPALLDAADVCTLTSRFEGLPRVVVEALAAGVPTVAMRVDGVDEVLEDGVNGFTVEPGDVAALAGRVVRLLRDSDLRTRLAARAPTGLDAFDRDLMVRQQEDLYRELLCQSGSS